MIKLLVLIGFMLHPFIQLFSSVQQFDSVKGQRLHFAFASMTASRIHAQTPEPFGASDMGIGNGTCVSKKGDVLLPT